MSTTAQKVEAVAATAVLGAAGAVFGGPVGLAVGLALGVGVDALILHIRLSKPGAAPTVSPGVVANAMVPGAATLPPGADVNAANQVVVLLRAAAATGHTVETAPAKVWLTKFQTSVGLPATGALDPASRAMLTLAAPSAASLPATTVLG